MTVKLWEAANIDYDCGMRSTDGEVRDGCHEGKYVDQTDYDAIKAENLSLHEQVAALQSREVCTVAHDDVDECGYCQRDHLAAVLQRIVDLIEVWALPASLAAGDHATART